MSLIDRLRMRALQRSPNPDADWYYVAAEDAQDTTFNMSSIGLINTAAILGGGASLIFGLGAVFAPGPWLWVFQLKSPHPSSDHHTLVHALLRNLGARDVALGGVMLLIWEVARNNASSEVRAAAARLLGWSMILGTLIPLADGISTLRCREEGLITTGGRWTELEHFGFIPLLAGTGGMLLGWFGSSSAKVKV